MPRFSIYKLHSRVIILQQIALGLSQWKNYFGHVFWDADVYIFQAILVTAPMSQAIVDYRTRLIPAARNNAAMHGYAGIEFPGRAASRCRGHSCMGRCSISRAA